MNYIPDLSPTDLPQSESILNRRLFQCGHYLYHHAAGPRQTAVIHLLQQNGPMHQQDIQQALDIQPGSASELISKLESKGFVCRRRNPDDKRKITISLTRQGLDMQIAPPAQTLTQRYAALDLQEQQQLTALIEKLLDSWNTGACGQ